MKKILLLYLTLFNLISSFACSKRSASPEFAQCKTTQNYFHNQCALARQLNQKSLERCPDCHDFDLKTNISSFKLWLKNVTLIGTCRLCHKALTPTSVAPKTISPKPALPQYSLPASTDSSDDSDGSDSSQNSPDIYWQTFAPRNLYRDGLYSTPSYHFTFSRPTSPQRLATNSERLAGQYLDELAKAMQDSAEEQRSGKLAGAFLEELKRANRTPGLFDSDDDDW